MSIVRGCSCATWPADQVRVVVRAEYSAKRQANGNALHPAAHNAAHNAHCPPELAMPFKLPFQSRTTTVRYVLRSLWCAWVCVCCVRMAVPADSHTAQDPDFCRPSPLLHWRWRLFCCVCLFASLAIRIPRIYLGVILIPRGPQKRNRGNPTL